MPRGRRNDMLEQMPWKALRSSSRFRKRYSSQVSATLVTRLRDLISVLGFKGSGIAGPKPPRPSFSKPLDNNSLQLSAARDPLVKDFTEARDTVQGRAVLKDSLPGEVQAAGDVPGLNLVQLSST